MNIATRISSIESGRRVIDQEASGLVALSAALDEKFSSAVRIVAATTGRVIVTGIGKSGHVARKIAATLASTGTPAFFVHPAEASHGDLGMLKPVDSLVVLSNSGATVELRAIVAHARQIGIPIIAIASKQDSPIVRQSTVALCIPRMAEACPVKIAPTTSTTMMLALGDALAIATMEMRGTSRADLMRLHPGGSIGWKLMPVDTLLREGDPLPLVRPGTGMRDVVLEMTSTGKGAAGVVDDDGNLVGIITDGDLRRSFDQMLIATAGDVMTRNPITVPSGTLIEDALTLLSEAAITVVFVMSRENPRHPIGLLHIHSMALGL
ncbi:KpsF/GutQ family sugar-phosphate isomerase [Sphingobium algorifonticola]|uniref:KpsF/GutQ family sugar-phosphate isomerase n=1 Tax=Sphingobium algorifonticola TaxID=2008318 RepID=A0A437J788_9SPHN|nr:KpsF/GutQ family sugar-phosphate isomerase [Sphingobium algorifonticola]RVT41015.1 KpsF/GutQ family sugar-phosphate isomerase [Sphingobium algorifonticola]